MMQQQALASSPPVLEVDVVTILPEMVAGAVAQGIVGRALERGRWRLQLSNPRDFAEDHYRSIDDRPYGGGPGMVMMAEPLARCLDAIAARRQAAGQPRARVICLSARGRPLTQQRVRELSREPALVLLCGRYEGIDERLIESRVDEEICIGDFVVSGGELPALLLIDAVVRWLPGVMNDADSPLQDSFVEGLLDCPHYTRPEQFEGRPVPAILLSGHHARIAAWRRQQALLETASRRPDLIEAARAQRLLGPGDEAVLAEFREQQARKPAV